MDKIEESSGFELDPASRVAIKILLCEEINAALKKRLRVKREVKS